MPSTEVRRPGDATYAGDALPAVEGHIAQLIDPATEGARTIVLTIDDESAGTGHDPSILDGGLETTWVVPTRSRRFAREQPPAPATRAVTPPSTTSVDAAEAPTTEHAAPGAPTGRAARRRPASELAWAGDLTWSSAREEAQAEVREVVLTRTPVDETPAFHLGGTATAAGEIALVGTPRPRRQRTTAERFSDRPDTIALWAVFLGVALILVAALS